jgi:hypothetical protein
MLEVVTEVVPEVVTVVGLTGGAAVAEDVRAGHTSEPHARSVGQQPPPKDAGQERNPVEQTNVLASVDVVAIVVVTIAGGVLVMEEVEAGELDSVDTLVGLAALIVLIIPIVLIVLVDGVTTTIEVAVTVDGTTVDEEMVDDVGVTTMTVVDVNTHPSS